MASAFYNPTFKQPSAGPPLLHRSPSPPHAFVEPLSPARPTPIEPSFNYPPLNDNINFTVRPEQAYGANVRARAYSTSHQPSHHRTASIDTLAEAALAITPPYNAHAFSPPRSFQTSAHGPSGRTQHPYAGTEPPHKRARSELLPSPFVEQYASRPASSYEVTNGWYGAAQASDAYKSRVEEAALLLNFQSGGSPHHALPDQSIPPAPVPRPHANSFPQAWNQPRLSETLTHDSPALLPPFSLQETQHYPHILPSPQRHDDDVAPLSHHYLPVVDGSGDVRMRDTHQSGVIGNVNHQTPDKRVELNGTQAGASGSGLPADESSPTPKKRRGWPKGKPRGTGARKTVAEKAATKRAALRKKNPEISSKKGKSEGLSKTSSHNRPLRRKSMSDARVFGEQEPLIQTSQPSSRPKSVPPETLMLIREPSQAKSVHRKAQVTSSTICAGCETSREATTSRGELDEWISCNGCKKWFHIDCAGFKKAHEVRDVDKFFCAACEPEHGKSTYVRKSNRAHASVDYAELQRGVLKTSEESMEHHYIQPIKDGSFTFDEETFPRMRPEMVTREFFERSGTFVEPICIPAEWNPRPWEKNASWSTNVSTSTAAEMADDDMADIEPQEFEYDTVEDLGQDKLNMVMPKNLTVRQVCNLVGPDWPIDVIDVKTQNSGAKWTLSKWADYYEDEGDQKAIRNVISLEVSQTKLGRLLQRPKLVRDIDLQDDVWPQEEIERGKYPKVQFYCLMSVADSYTDFHIDFGGSSVYYHILEGKKTFFFIPPKPKHLKAYEEWNDSPQQNYTFLPSITKECYRVDLTKGDTMLIPSGWIHAVWTPEDSLVIGGNFLNRMSYKNQFKVVEIEKANETPIKFRYPFFQKIMWYTAIKYMGDDPMPEAVSQLFHEGKMFQRDVPVWGDFDGDLAASDPRPGAHNARFYSQAEVDGLPDLANFIFRTAILVLGRVEGVSADRIKRVNASIPKGHGEPLELAKSFALWVAWKRGNEHPPAWSHPDAVLPTSKEEGPPKKLSERKLKELERKEAIAAYRVAPDRQSVRVMTKNAKEAATASTTSTPHEKNAMPAAGHYDAPPPSQNYHTPIAYYGDQAPPTMQPYTATPPMTFVMSNIPSHHLSTPKTSVLGPKRVACDTCRRRRIRCKHKEVVKHTPTTSTSYLDGVNPPFKTQPVADLHDNITVTPPTQSGYANFMSTVMDGQPNVAHNEVNLNGEQNENDIHMVDGLASQSGMNFYAQADLPVIPNGEPESRDMQKKSRSKACYECRKSKRRCIHDEHGNVDPVKATETPAPRSVVSTKKRHSNEHGNPLLAVKKQRQADPNEHLTHTPTAQALPMQDYDATEAQPIPYESRTQLQPSAEPQGSPRSSNYQRHYEQQAQIDPNLYSAHIQSQGNNDYGLGPYPYNPMEHAQTYNDPLPSLEEIANEVLVDLNGNEDTEDHYDMHQPNGDHNSPPNGPPKTDESVDSAISLPTTEVLEQRTVDSGLTTDQEPTANQDVEMASGLVDSTSADAQSSIETNGVLAQSEHTLLSNGVAASPDRTEGCTSTLPLSEPTATLSQSPDDVKYQTNLTNGLDNSESTTAPVESTPPKRKRGSTSGHAKGTKKTKGNKTAALDTPEARAKAERQSLELAKVLQQQDLGLRRRSK